MIKSLGNLIDFMRGRVLHSGWAKKTDKVTKHSYKLLSGAFLFYCIDSELLNMQKFPISALKSTWPRASRQPVFQHAESLIWNITIQVSQSSKWYVESIRTATITWLARPHKSYASLFSRIISLLWSSSKVMCYTLSYLYISKTGNRWSSHL